MASHVNKLGSLEFIRKLAFYESEYRKLKEAASVLELSRLEGKYKMNQGVMMLLEKNVDNKKLKMDESEFRIAVPD